MEPLVANYFDYPTEIALVIRRYTTRSMLLNNMQPQPSLRLFFCLLCVCLCLFCVIFHLVGTVHEIG